MGVTREQGKIVDTIHAQGDLETRRQAWPYSFSMGASLNAHVGDSEPDIMLYESRARRGVWFAMIVSSAKPWWVAGPGDLDDVVDDVVDFLLDETIRADAPRLALARAEQAEREG